MFLYNPLILQPVFCVQRLHVPYQSGWPQTCVSASDNEPSLCLLSVNYQGIIAWWLLGGESVCCCRTPLANSDSTRAAVQIIPLPLNFFLCIKCVNVLCSALLWSVKIVAEVCSGFVHLYKSILSMHSFTERLLKVLDVRLSGQATCPRQLLHAHLTKVTVVLSTSEQLNQCTHEPVWEAFAFHWWAGSGSHILLLLLFLCKLIFSVSKMILNFRFLEMFVCCNFPQIHIVPAPTVFFLFRNIAQSEDVSTEIEKSSTQRWLRLTEGPSVWSQLMYQNRSN